MNQVTPKQYIISDLVMLLHDNPQAGTEGKTEILEAYFNDIYKLFLAKLARFEAAPALEDKDKAKLRSLLDEMINVKGLLVD